MDMEPLVLIANPGSASRKYALYEGQTLRASVHFELDNDQVIYTYTAGENGTSSATQLSELRASAGTVVQLLRDKGALLPDEALSRIGLRVVAPGSYFAQNRIVDDTFTAQLQGALLRAPLHVAAALDEMYALREQFPDTTIVGISDSAFHSTKPSEAWLYGFPLEDADRLDIKRNGYHGLSVASVVHTLVQHHTLPEKLVVAHIGSGVSVTAVSRGLSADTTMGYSPLEGVIMATRSGSVDPTAAGVLRTELGLDEKAFENYLNTKCGLLGLGGSSDVRELLERESTGDHRATLALQTYVYHLQKAIGQMTAALDGVDALVFTGTIGLRSAPIRERVAARLSYLGFSLNPAANAADATKPITNIAGQGSKPIYIIATDEQGIMAKQTIAMELPAPGDTGVADQI